MNTAGPGIVLGISGTVSIKEGAGLTFDGSGALVSDVFSTGGLMVTTDNVNPAILTTASAQLALTNTGVLAGTYNNVSTAITPFTVDAKGRITSVGSAIPIVSSFSSLTGIPSTIAGYGITDAVKKTGDTMSGSLLFGGGTAISGTAPSASSAYVSTGAYGIAQGDNRTHFGFLTGGIYMNYIRGSDTIVNGTLHGDAVYDGTFRVLTTNTVGSYAPALTGTGASGTWGINVTGSASSATLASKASTLAQGGADGSPMTFNWSGQAGQPSWLWGSNDGSSTNVYNPANFSVSYAGTATYLSATQQTNAITGAQASMSMTTGGAGGQGSFTAKASGGSDANLAGMTFWNDTYAIKMGVRSDGYFGLGGWSRAAWSWYSDPSGNMVAAGNVAAYSDPRLKENITPILGAVSILQQLNGVRFSWKYGYPHIEVKAGKQDIGVLANEVQAVLPEIVTESIEIEGQRYKTVAYDKIVPVLIEAIKELKAEIELLKIKVS